jgi:transposase InsO family protein
MGLGEKKQTVTRYNSFGLKLAIALPIAGISKHQYYYRKKFGSPGRKPTKKTLKIKDGKEIYEDNSKVIQDIKSNRIKAQTNYGYDASTQALRQQGWIINPKKTNRLMRENYLLLRKKQRVKKNYVKHRKVQPLRPLEVIEMDLKMVWVERDRRHAFILNIIDTFNRKWLYHYVAFSITHKQVKRAWEHLIEHHLQPNDLLKNQLHIEIRNDNDKRFSAKMIQEFFRENHLSQVFTHPYTPQENGHVESFHAILNQHLKKFTFWNISELEQNLILFQDTYNNHRIHGSIAHLTPNDFEKLWEKKQIIMYSNINKRKVIFKLKIPRHQINQITGNYEPEGNSSLDYEPLEGAIQSTKEIIGTKISKQLTV